MVYMMSKQIIWSTGIIVAWTPAIYICPEWMWKAPLISKAPARLIILVIYVITPYDQLSADADIVDGLKCAV